MKTTVFWDMTLCSTAIMYW